MALNDVEARADGPKSCRSPCTRPVGVDPEVAGLPRHLDRAVERRLVVVPVKQRNKEINHKEINYNSPKRGTDQHGIVDTIAQNR